MAAKPVPIYPLPGQPNIDLPAVPLRWAASYLGQLALNYPGADIAWPVSITQLREETPEEKAEALLNANMKPNGDVELDSAEVAELVALFKASLDAQKKPR